MILRILFLIGVCYACASLRGPLGAITAVSLLGLWYILDDDDDEPKPA
jgi:hypothetical protein